MYLSEKNIRNIIKNGENERAEFKSGIHIDILNIYPIICAFANSKGGVFFLGVSDSGEIIGCNPDQLNKVANRLRADLLQEKFISPKIIADINIIKIDNKYILYIHVKKSVANHKFKGTAFYRIKDRTVTQDTAKAYNRINRSGVYNFLAHSDKSTISSYDAAFRILKPFKEWVENNKGWQTILDFPEKTREKHIQRLIDLKGREYCEKNNIDMSFEANEGPGPLDLKLSRGNDKTVIEIKLSSNPQYLHGFTTQIEEYAKSENTDKKIYVYIDIGNPIRTEKLKDLYNQMKSADKKPAHLYIIDSTKKKSASKK